MAHHSPNFIFLPLVKYLQNPIDKTFFYAIIIVMCCHRNTRSKKSFPSFLQQRRKTDEDRPEFVRRKSEVDNGNTDGNCRSTYFFNGNMFLDVHNLRS